jgi:uncharacterized repeat protein (TIGR02543 family)
MESVFEYTFTSVHFSNSIFVTREEDDENQGSLRWAIEQAKERIESTIIIDSSRVKKIELKESLSINKEDFEIFENITIEGNGVIITQNNFLEINSLLYIYNNAGGETALGVKIRRVHFTGGDASSGGAISSEHVSLFIESCIFSDNHAASSGGAIYIGDGGIITDIKGCTFYGNNTETIGSAIFTYSALSIIGNLFYGNTDSNNLVVRYMEGDINIFSENVTDVYQSWVSTSDNKYIINPTVIHKTFKPISRNESVDFFNPLPYDYPTEDFYGTPITAPASAGAVQEKMSNTVTITFNNTEDRKFFPVAIISGGTLGRPDDPKRLGYNFINWYKDEMFNNEMDFSSPINENIDLYAKWSGKTSVEDAIEWINKQSDAGKGTSIYDPIFLPMELNLESMNEGSKLDNLLIAIGEKDKFVNLDLSACSMNEYEFNPASITNDNAQKGKKKIVEIVLPNSAAKITDTPTASTFNNFDNLKSFRGSGLTYIGMQAFSGCKNLDMSHYGMVLPLPEGIKTISNNAFSGCSGLTQITLQAEVANIGNNAFSNCSQLAIVICHSITPPALGTDVFLNTRDDMVIMVPAGSVTAYKAAANWNAYAAKIIPIPE